jgi:2-amino-4-hydroxy-6-hydroxymethyldihydropteridine diphosphokinase
MASLPGIARYALAIGSNRPLSRRMMPNALLHAATAAIAQVGDVLAIAPIFSTAPIGPSRRRYANSALIVQSSLPPPAMLAALQAIETRFGRRRAQRWAARTLDIDILFWSGGKFSSAGLTIPHPALSGRDFVLAPLARVAPRWRDPRSGLAVTHLCSRLLKSRPQKPRCKG